jgi:hypothetical protein
MFSGAIKSGAGMGGGKPELNKLNRQMFIHYF